MGRELLFTISAEHVACRRLISESAMNATPVERQAAKARSVMGVLQAGDIGKRVYGGAGLTTQVENDSQRDARKARLESLGFRFDPKPSLSPYWQAIADSIARQLPNDGNRIADALNRTIAELGLTEGKRP